MDAFWGSLDNMITCSRRTLALARGAGRRNDRRRDKPVGLRGKSDDTIDSTDSTVHIHEGSEVVVRQCHGSLYNRE